jgi:hypothetical protein
VYVKNLGATPIKIKGTPSGGAEAILCAALPQNGVLIVWNTVNNVADVGYTSIKLSCGVVDNPVEYYIGG